MSLLRLFCRFKQSIWYAFDYENITEWYGANKSKLECIKVEGDDSKCELGTFCDGKIWNSKV